MDDIETVVQGKLDADTEFQATLEGLSDDDKNTAIAGKRKELLNAEFKTLADEKAKHEKIGNDQRIRAEKAEKASKGGDQGGGDSQPQDVLSPKDQYAISQAGVHIDDFDFVMEQSKVYGGVTKALANDDVKAALESRSAKRKTAEAANTKVQRPGQKSVSDEQLLKDAAEGKYPDKGSPEAERLFHLRRGKSSGK